MLEMIVVEGQEKLLKAFQNEQTKNNKISPKLFKVDKVEEYLLLCHSSKKGEIYIELKGQPYLCCLKTLEKLLIKAKPSLVGQTVYLCCCNPQAFVDSSDKTKLINFVHVAHEVDTLKQNGHLHTGVFVDMDDNVVFTIY